MGKQASKIVREEFSQESAINRLEAIYDEAIAMKPGA
jgi:hypothetical protein